LRILGAVAVLISVALPVLYHHLHEYQRQRILTFLDPERDPLGTGYHIIQSKIAVGSGGLWGKGLFHGSQSRLNFLPEHTTDFIFAVAGEELGFVGCAAVIILMLFIIFRCLHIVREAQDNFSRLLAAGLTLSFFLSAFVNIGMVTGILPVVGIPLPLVSYGGTSLVTLSIGFGILMSIHTHRTLFRGLS
jgi:rod shape determining protein RodA